MNHFHIQLITRYSFEKRGSKNFVKPRFEYKEDKQKLMQLRIKLLEKIDNKKFVLGIKWHPELMIEDEATEKIFKNFIKQCKNYY